MEKTEIKQIIKDQNEFKEEEKIIDRDLFDNLEKNIKNNFVLILSGIRRSGKSTLLKQLIKKYPGYFVNFDDDRFVNFGVDDFQKLYESLIEMYGEKNKFYFDEIQNIKGWERFVRRLNDNKEKVVVTGSNATLLSRELGTHLTGRNINFELFPFSFKEFLKFSDFEIKKEYNSIEKSKLLSFFEQYFKKGGLPEFVKTSNKEYLKNLYDNIIYRDIISRYNLSSEKNLKELVYLALNSLGKEISFNSIKKNIGFGSSTTVKEYFDYLENSYMIFLIPKFDYSLKKQIFANKKVYVIDNAFAINQGFRFSGDYGRLLENIVFLELKRKNNEIFYYSDKRECDFILRKGSNIDEAIQVCFELNKDNEKREIEGLIEAMDKFNLKRGLILTNDQEKEINLNNKIIIIKPVWKWLLE